MMRNGRASPATAESMSICRMWSSGSAGSMSTRPSPLKVTDVLPAGVTVTFVFGPASPFE